MARPAKAVNTKAGVLPKREEAYRLRAEAKLRGSDDRVKPPEHLNSAQKNIFENIVGELAQSGILGNLDIYILSACAIAIDRLRQIESRINEDFDLLCDAKLMAAKDKYAKDLYRCCSELSLSPQARAKIGSLSLQAEKKDPLLELLNDAAGD